MRTIHHRWIALGLLALGAALAAPARADETLTELAVGGLVVARPADIVTDSQDLAITPETVRIRYQFRNATAAPITATMTFPLPDLDFADPDASYAIPGSNAVNFVDFATTVDGRAVPFTITQKALVGDRDITALLRQFKLNLVPIGDFQNQLEALDTASRSRLVAGGALTESGTDVSGRPLLAPTWTLRTTVARQQVFPPGQLVAVEHRYRTSVGVRQDTALRRPLRQSDGLKAELDRTRADFCVDDGLIAGVDRLAGVQDANAGRLSERRITYVLTNAATSVNPIRAFHLVVDKGKPDRLVSFCMNGLTKISPTAFEMRAQNFVPDGDLKILLVGRY